VSALRVRLGQDRLRGGRASGAERRREQHPRPRTRLCQQQMWNFLTRSTRLQQTDRAGMMNFLAPEEVPFSTQVAPHERCLASCIHLRAGARAIQRRRAHPVVLTSGWRSGRQPRAAVGGGMHTPRMECFVQPLCCCWRLGALSRRGAFTAPRVLSSRRPYRRLWFRCCRSPYVRRPLVGMRFFSNFCSSVPSTWR